MLPRILDTRFSPLLIHVPLFRAPRVHASCEIGVGVLCGVRINPLILSKFKASLTCAGRSPIPVFEISCTVTYEFGFSSFLLLLTSFLLWLLNSCSWPSMFSIPALRSFFPF
jgi:hypothetical protein